jgi:anionic cell wall polymer biosynthesis LytR-Cps2A-Psr (LCP) family protein
LLDTVQKLTGIPVNYLITLNFHGFKLIVNKLHGVYVDVDHRYINTQGGSTAMPRSTCIPDTSGSTANRRSTSCVSVTRTRISTATRASSCSSKR